MCWRSRIAKATCRRFRRMVARCSACAPGKFSDPSAEALRRGITEHGPLSEIALFRPSLLQIGWAVFPRREAALPEFNAWLREASERERVCRHGVTGRDAAA